MLGWVYLFCRGCMYVPALWIILDVLTHNIFKVYHFTIELKQELYFVKLTIYLNTLRTIWKYIKTDCNVLLL